MNTQTGAATVAADTQNYEALLAAIDTYKVNEDYSITFTVRAHTEAARALLFHWARGADK